MVQILPRLGGALPLAVGTNVHPPLILLLRQTLTHLRPGHPLPPPGGLHPTAGTVLQVGGTVGRLIPTCAQLT